MISRFAKNLNSEYFYAINQILRYLAENQNRGIIFRKQKKVEAS